MDERERTVNDPNADRERLTFAQAAERLGASRGAVRMRVRRGTLETIAVNGERYVLWPPRSAVRGDALIDAQRDEIAHLRQLLADEIEARRRADHLLAGALERLAALSETAGNDADTAVASNQSAGATKPTAMASEAHIIDLDAAAALDCGRMTGADHSPPMVMSARSVLDHSLLTLARCCVPTPSAGTTPIGGTTPATPTTGTTITPAGNKGTECAATGAA